MKVKDKLRLKWSKKENDIMAHFPLGIGTKSDAAYLVSIVFSPEKIEELKKRGYDIASIKFEVSPQVGNEKFSSQRAT